MPDPFRLFHVSEEADIAVFRPRPSPTGFEAIQGDVVFAISGRLLHNYLFPRHCPRVTYYSTPESTESDKKRYFGESSARYILAIEEKWVPFIQQSTIYVYEFPVENFMLIDLSAEYYVSYKKVYPISVVQMVNPLKELLKRPDVELRILPEIVSLADGISKSSLNFSLIRMQNAQKT